MKSALATMALACAWTGSAFAQAPASRPPASGEAARPPAMPSAASAPRPFLNTPPSVTPPTPAPDPGASGPKTFKNGAALPEPLAPDEVPAPALALPTEPIGPYMLTKDAGPFMVNAHVFRGPDATRYAQALAIELRNEYRLPAYVFHLKFLPGHSNIRGVPPTAPDYVHAPHLSDPEASRSYDEAAVLVGQCKTIDDSEKVLHQVKKIHPKCLDKVPSILPWRKGQGLSRATLTTNPLVAAQNIYPGKEAVAAGHAVDPFVLTSRFETPADGSVLTVNHQVIDRPPSTRPVEAFIKRINAGPRNIFHCPGPYTLQVAEFSGGSAFGTQGPTVRDDGALKQSPLLTAHEDAENLAAALAKSEELRRLGCQPYVYHDRMSSRVTVGSFQTPGDPRAETVRQAILKLSIEVKKRNGGLFEISQKMAKVPLAPSATLLPVPRS
jgi:hypothetical protein